MEINEMVKIVHETAKAKGWYDANAARKPAELHMLMVTEIAEATEEVRKQTPPIYYEVPVYILGNKETAIVAHDSEDFKKYGGVKPEGEAVELADAVIRIMDYFGFKGWDLEAVIKLKHEFNLTRSQRHGGKAL